MFEFRPQQVDAIDAVQNAWQSGIRRPLVNMCVGSGKSLAMAGTALQNWNAGQRTIILSHRQELVVQDQDACRKLGLLCGINAAKLHERTWRAPVISAMINSVYNKALSFGPIQNILIDECHLIPFEASGMYREFLRGFPDARIAGFSGTPFRLQGGSLVSGEDAFFDKIVYDYGIEDGIRDGYLVPAFSAEADDQIDTSLLRKTAGEYTGTSQDAQMIALMDSHISQMVMNGADRRSWLIFEASQKAALAMTERLNAWGVPADVVIDKTKNRKQILDAFGSGRLRALVNVESLTTGYDSQRIDLVCMRRKTASLGLYTQMVGRGLRTIGGNIESSILAGKPDCLVFDFAGNITQHGPLNMIEPKESKVRMVECEECGKRNGAASARCWSCDALMTKLCPACLETVTKGTLDCPHCQHDMRTGGAGSDPKPQNLLEKPSGAALISSFGAIAPKAGGWLPVRKVWHGDGMTILDGNGDRWSLPVGLEAHAKDARWIRGEAGVVAAILKRNGSSLGSALQVTVDGMVLPVPMPNNC